MHMCVFEKFLGKDPWVSASLLLLAQCRRVISGGDAREAAFLTQAIEGTKRHWRRVGVRFRVATCADAYARADLPDVVDGGR